MRFSTVALIGLILMVSVIGFSAIADTPTSGEMSGEITINQTRTVNAESGPGIGFVNYNGVRWWFNSTYETRYWTQMTITGLSPGTTGDLSDTGYFRLTDINTGAWLCSGTWAYDDAQTVVFQNTGNYANISTSTQVWFVVTTGTGTLPFAYRAMNPAEGNSCTIVMGIYPCCNPYIISGSYEARFDFPYDVAFTQETDGTGLSVVTVSSENNVRLKSTFIKGETLTQVVNDDRDASIQFSTWERPFSLLLQTYDNPATTIDDTQQGSSAWIFYDEYLFNTSDKQRPDTQNVTEMFDATFTANIEDAARTLLDLQDITDKEEVAIITPFYNAYASTGNHRGEITTLVEDADNTDDSFYFPFSPYGQIVLHTHNGAGDQRLSWDDYWSEYGFVNNSAYAYVECDRNGLSFFTRGALWEKRINVDLS